MNNMIVPPPISQFRNTERKLNGSNIFYKATADRSEIHKENYRLIAMVDTMPES